MPNHLLGEHVPTAAFLKSLSVFIDLFVNDLVRIRVYEGDVNRTLALQLWKDFERMSFLSDDASGSKECSGKDYAGGLEVNHDAHRSEELGS